MKTKLTLALAAALTSTAFAAFQAPLPEFKTEKQLAAWRAAKAAEPTSQKHMAEETAFYTGKPYIEASGAYAFKYRSYNPELARWTSEDPSGFSDGANTNIYAPIPTCGFDYAGLNAQLVFSNRNQSITMSVYVYDATGTNMTQNTLNSWKSAIEGAWTFSGTDVSNGGSLNMTTTVNFTLQSGGTINSQAALSCDNLIRFTTNPNNEVYGSQEGAFRFDIPTNTLIHEFGHFMLGHDKYTSSVVNGVRTTAALEGWGGTIMGTSAATATKKDANYILSQLGGDPHLFE